MSVLGAVFELLFRMVGLVASVAIAVGALLFSAIGILISLISLFPVILIFGFVFLVIL